ncbi:TPA: head-tail adaptor protein [Streptococcus suis]|nr:head-tail adaptor protein [Streptococcus suis]HEL1978127.1 head-tail adaptor protein [Streptococcus suis]
MRIAPLREQLVFQTRLITQDQVGNEFSKWDDLFLRWCSCKTLTLTEIDGNTYRLNHTKVQFTLRYDKAVLSLDSLKTRIIFRNQIYQIESIDGDALPRQLIYIVATKEKNSYD